MQQIGEVQFLKMCPRHSKQGFVYLLFILCSIVHEIVMIIFGYDGMNINHSLILSEKFGPD